MISRNRKALIIPGLFVAIGLAGCDRLEEYTTEKSAVVSLDIAPCDPPFEGVEADCGALNVYENRETKSGRVIPINFIRVRATGDDPQPDLVISLAGGPGAAGTRGAEQAIKFEPALKDRDLLLVDQRGTGGSNPLDCVKFDLENRPEAFAEMFETNIFDADRMRACKEELSERADLTQYTTSIAADDINDLREALGYKEMTLAGASYGTTFALEIIRRHGKHVRAAVLTGAMPTTIDQTETIARDMEDMLEVLFADCEADEACSAAFPNFRNDFHEVMARVREAPVEIVLPHTLTDAPEPVLIRYGELAAAVRYTLYSTEISAGLPAAVEQAKNGDYSRLAGFLPQLIFSLGNAAHEGMWASVRCAEEFPYLDIEHTREISEGTVLGTERLDSGLAICEFWPRGKAAANFRDPVVSDVPVLIISGGVDAATPPWMGADAVQYLENGRQIIAPKRSHWDLFDDCINGIVEAFLETTSVAELDDGCFADYERTPFIIPE